MAVQNELNKLKTSKKKASCLADCANKKRELAVGDLRSIVPSDINIPNNISLCSLDKTRALLSAEVRRTIPAVEENEYKSVFNHPLVSAGARTISSPIIMGFLV